MKLLPALVVALAMLVVAVVALAPAPTGGELRTVLGTSTGALGGALLALTCMAWRWRSESPAWEASVIVSDDESVIAVIDEAADDEIAAVS